jgi:hypothetical protein
MTHDELWDVIKGITPVLYSELAKRDAAIESLTQSVAELKSRPELKWAGAYRAGESYAPGCFVQRSGGLWLCERSTSAIPGAADSGWRLVVKEGRST